mgnify:CR=1 FL=1|tara:strand:- start:935 stop:2509 length:1575 start_codon:yes stop_codon:yes gene_type:complete
METIITGAEARSKLLKGVNKLASSIEGTFGPQARTVIIQNPMGMPVILNDGVTIARAVTDSDPYVQMGIDLLKEVASEAQQKSGDGTTGATLIARTLSNGSLSLMESGVSPLVIRDNLKELLKETEEYLDDLTISKNKLSSWSLLDVATIASNNDRELGEIIASVVERGGGVTIEKSPTYETYVRESSGLEINAGMAHALMANMPRGRCELDNALVLTTTERIDTFNMIIPALESAVQEGRPLVVFCPDFNPQMLQNLLVNIVQGKVSVCLIKVAGMPQQQQDWLEDICASTGSKLFKKSLNESIVKLTSEDLGECEKVHSDSKTTTLTLKENVPSLEQHTDALLDACVAEENEWLQEQMQNRLNRLTTGISTIYVGGASDVEQVETKERVDDAVNACRLALESGVVVGGGATLARIATILRSKWQDCHEYEHTLNLFCDALTTPVMTIIKNAGEDIDKEEIYESLDVSMEIYYNGNTGKVGDAFSDGVYDPKEVILNSLRSAVSIAALVLMTDVAIIAPRDSL